MVARSRSKKQYQDLVRWCASASSASGRIWIGIDPGLNGALAFISESGEYCVLSTPVKNVIKGKKEKKEYDIYAMCNALIPFAKKSVLVCQELTHAMPGNGNVSMYSFGRGHGLWESAVMSINMPLIFVLPQQWKKNYNSLLPKVKITDKKDKQKFKSESKKEAIKIAKDMYPLMHESLKKVSDDGKAEALLIANYCKTLSEGHGRKNK